MKRIFLSALAISTAGAIFQIFSGSKAAPPQQSYPLVCRGGGSLVTGAAPGDRNIGFTFARGSKPAGEGLAPGECSWADRGMYSNEPDRVSQHLEAGSSTLEAGGTLAPENSWFEELHSSDSYWTFMVANNGRGQLIATSARRNSETRSSLQRRPQPRSEQETPRPGRQIENPILAGLELSQIQSISPSCPNGGIASLQIRTTSGTLFTSRSSCFPYLCDPDTKTCATGCKGNRDCAQGMDCVSGQCEFPRTFCSNMSTSANSRGATEDCSPFLCNKVTGLCRTVCNTADDCTVGTACNPDTNRCTSQPG